MTALTVAESAQLDYVADGLRMDLLASDVADAGNLRKANAIRHASALAYMAGLAEKFDPTPSVIVPCHLCGGILVCDLERHGKIGKLPPCVPVREFGW